MKNRNKILFYLGFIVLFLSVAVIGYMVILDVNFVDAIYMTVITVSTVGYKEVTEMTQGGKIFSVFVIIISVGFIGIAFSQIVRYLSEGLVNEVWRRKTMNKEIMELKNHIIVCGAGETGLTVIKQLRKNKVDFVVIDSDKELKPYFDELGIYYIIGDATDEDYLKLTNIEQAQGLIAALSTDANNVYVVLTARGLNQGLHIVARSHEEKSYKKLKRAGADNTVSPNEIGGKKIARMMLKPSLSSFMDHIIDTGNISIDMEEVTICKGSELVGKSLKEAKISEKTGLIVLAIRRESEDEFIFNPGADEKLEKNDKMIVVGKKEQIEDLRVLSCDI